MKTSSNRKKKINSTPRISRRTLRIIIGLFFILAAGLLIYIAIMRAQTLSYKIVEAQTIEDIYKYINADEFNKKTIVIFDIDNTLIFPKTIIGSEQWFYSMVSKYEKEGMTTQEAIDTILPQSFEFLEYIPMYPVEPATIPVINDLQKRGVVTIALTARSLDLTYRTIEQLAQLGIHFNGTGPVKCPIIYGDGKPAIYIEGIIFCGNHAKGEVLLDWFHQINYHPHKIIFLDDKLKNVEAVKKILPKNHYAYIGMRYAYLDEHKEKISSYIIEKEIKDFGHEYPDARPITPMYE